VTGAELRIGVVLEAFLDWPLEDVLPWLREAAPEITDLEVGAGGYAPRRRGWTRSRGTACGWTR